jgi:fatty-acyl-CoA synthase
MLSYARGPDAPVIERTIPQALSEVIARFEDRQALVVRHQEVRYTYRDLDHEIERTAQGLAGLGLRPGDRFGIWSSNCVEWVLLWLAGMRAGLVSVNVNPAYRSHDLAYVIRKSGMRALFLWEQDARVNYRQILSEAAVPVEQLVWLGTDSWTRMLESGREYTVRADPDDVVNIQYTSGTTGSPKGVLLTHRGLVNNAWLGGECMGMTESDRMYCSLPLYHCAGCVCSLLGATLRGAALLLPSAQFDPLAVLQTIHEERATIGGGVPTMLIAMLDHPEFSRFKLTSLRFMFSGGAPVPVELMKQVNQRMHCDTVAIIYGQTEASPIITMSRPGDNFEQRISTVGAPIANTEVKIISPSTGETVPVGEQGELCARGLLVMKGYDQEPEATAGTIDAEGWLHTGDLATIGPDGHFRITGRTKDMIIRGGENIFPREIEEFLFTCPKIVNVAVVGVSHPTLGEAVLAWIQLRAGETATEEEMRQFCQGKIARFKIPHYIRFVDAFPLTVTGKIQKFRIREIEVAERGLEREGALETG